MLRAVSLVLRHGALGVLFAIWSTTGFEFRTRTRTFQKSSSSRNFLRGSTQLNPLYLVICFFVFVFDGKSREGKVPLWQ